MSEDRRRQRGERTREAILEAALQLLGEPGAGGVTAQMLAQRAGVSQGALFHHFPTLEDIVLDAGMRLFDHITMTVRERAGGRLEDYVHQLGTVSLGVLREQPRMIRTFFALVQYLHNERFRRRLADYYAAQVAGIAEDLQALEPPIRDPVRARDLATTLTMLYDGMGVHWLIHQDLHALEDYWRRRASWFARLAQTD